MSRRLIWAITIALFLAFVYLADQATTPDMCKVPFDQLSQACLDLLYP